MKLTMDSKEHVITFGALELTYQLQLHNVVFIVRSKATTSSNNIIRYTLNDEVQYGAYVGIIDSTMIASKLQLQVILVHIICNLQVDIVEFKGCLDDL